MDVRGCCTCLWVLAPPFLGFVPFWCVACLAVLGLGLACLFSFALLVLLMFSLSPLSSVSFSALGVVFVDRLGWCPRSRSILLWVSAASTPLRCRVGSASASQVSALVGFLRSARASGFGIVLGVRSGWSAGEWFCAARLASELELAVWQAEQDQEEEEAVADTERLELYHLTLQASKAFDHNLMLRSGN